MAGEREVVELGELRKGEPSLDMTFSFKRGVRDLILRLQRKLQDAEKPEDVVLKGLELLQAAEDKQLQIVDGNKIEVVYLWKNQG